MCIILSQRTLGFKTVTACVFWTLTFLSPQPLDGAPDDEWGTFFDFYGPNLELVPENIGDVLQKEDGSLLLIASWYQYFQMETHDIQEDQKEVRCHFYTYPQRNDYWPKRKMKIMRKAPKPELTIALAYRFADRFLPFDPEECNKLHYMNYILYEHPKFNQVHFKDCPLAAPWWEMTPVQIALGEFKLIDTNKRTHDFTEYNSSKHPRPEPQTYVATTMLKPLGRSESWLKRAYSLRRKVSRTIASSSGPNLNNQPSFDAKRQRVV